MSTITFGKKTYTLDDHGFLRTPDQWDRNFADGMARFLGITGGLTDRHWKVIDFIREHVRATKDLPYLHQACQAAGLSLEGIRGLFPSGYHRGACKIAGISHAFMGGCNIWFTYETTQLSRMAARTGPLGFLKNTQDWSKEFAESTASNHGIEGGLSERHWLVINSIRERFAETGTVPLVYEICSKNDLSVGELMDLFPRGYHRGACKIAGIHPRV